MAEGHDPLGCPRVNVKLDLVPFKGGHYGLSHAPQSLGEGLGRELRLGHRQLEQKLGAVAEGEVAVAVKEGVVHDGGVPARGLGGCGDLLPHQILADTLEEVDHTRAAAVHHARLLEDSQKIGGALQGYLGHGGHEGDGLLHRAQGGQLPVHLGGDVPQYREDGPLHGIGHRSVGVGTASVQRGGQHRHVGLGVPLKARRKAAEELGEDDPRVAPRPEDRGTREGQRHPREVSLGSLNGLVAVLNRHGHVGARVSVGDGEDVEVVDGGLVCLQIGQAVSDHIPKYGTVDFFQCFLLLIRRIGFPVRVGSYRTDSMTRPMISRSRASSSVTSSPRKYTPTMPGPMLVPLAE